MIQTTLIFYFVIDLMQWSHFQFLVHMSQHLLRELQLKQLQQNQLRMISF